MSKISLHQALTFSDVLLIPAASEVLPHEVDTSSYLTKDIKLNVPIISSAMDTVTESKLAIAMAQNGGIGCIHRNLSIEKQHEEVAKVKKFEAGMVINPITIAPHATLGEAKNLAAKHNISGIPVVEEDGNLVGMLSNRDMRFMDDLNVKVSSIMTKKNLITVKENICREDAKKLLHSNRIEKLLVVDDQYKCIGLITLTDIEKEENFPNSCRDVKGRLRVTAAVGTGDDSFDRVSALVDAQVDAIIIDTAHGHSKKVLETIEKVKKQFSSLNVIAGNIATTEGAKALIDSGVDAVKVGIGPGSICTTRIIAGVGIPQLTAIMNAAEICNKKNIPVIADGGIKYSGDFAKAIAAGASCIMAGSILAGTDESPGEVILYQGRSFKTYRGMGSVGAMAKGSADRYFQGNIDDSLKLVPEGVEGIVPSKGPLSNVIYQLIGGLRASMGYTGNKDISSMKKNCKFVQITNAGLKESHVHDIKITRETPNYAT